MGQEIAHEDDDGGGDADKDGTGWVQYSSVRFHLYSPCAGTKSTHSVMKSSGILWKWVWRSAAPPKTINLSSCFVLNSLHQLARRSPEKNLMGHSPKLLVVQTCSTQFKIVVILCGMFWFELNLCWWTPYVLNQTVFCKMIVLLEKNPMLNSGGVYHVYPIKSTAQIFGEISIHRTLSVGGLVRTVFCSLLDGIDGIRHDISHM